jgi:hypothetical protein
MLQLHGFYDVSWGASGSQAQKIARQKASLTSAANLGANLMHLSHLQDLKATGLLLDVAAAHGVSVILEDILPADIRALSTKPALLAHSVADDANVKPLATVQAACTASDCLPRYLSHGPSLKDSHPELYGVSEIVGVQSYPYPTEQLLSSYLVWSAARQNADQAGVRVFGNAQLHSVGDGKPTAEQVRAQVWTAAVCGLDGLLAYTLLDDAGPADPLLVKAFTAACAEVGALCSGRPQVNLAPNKLSLTASWPGGVRLALNLDKGRVTSLSRR